MQCLVSLSVLLVLIRLGLHRGIGVKVEGAVANLVVVGHSLGVMESIPFAVVRMHVFWCRGDDHLDVIPVSRFRRFMHFGQGESGATGRWLRHCRLPGLELPGQLGWQCWSGGLCGFPRRRRSSWFHFRFGRWRWPGWPDLLFDQVCRACCSPSCSREVLGVLLL